MANIISRSTELIGRTPLLDASRFAKKEGVTDARILVKVEALNPSGSVKDRIALAMVEDAEKSGKLAPGGTIIEPTSGNTGIGIAAVAASKGYHAIIVLPDTMSVERRNLLKAYGAELVLTEGAKGMKGAIAKANELQEQTPGSVVLGQFDNPANPKIHEATTGTGKYLKSKKASVRVVAVEPDTSAVLSGENPGPHKIQGIGAGFIPKVLDTTVYDEIVRVTNEDAFAYGRDFATTEGILVGISSGAALKAAVELAKRPEFKGKTIVALLPDSGDRYLSTALFSGEA